VLKAKNLSLEIPLYRPEAQSVANPVSMFKSLYSLGDPRETTKVLDNFSFELENGDRLGIIGPNGAGKTTLLRVLAGVYNTYTGTLEFTGRVSGIFDHRLGMSPLATGRENIILRGLQIGMSVKEINALMPDIIEFSELDENALNKPFNVYSNGMKLRLSIAASMLYSPEILIMDEWIGAGDRNFRKKLDARLNKIVGESKCVVLATHSMGLLKANCNKGLLVVGGKQVYFGTIEDAIKKYREMEFK